MRLHSAILSLLLSALAASQAVAAPDVAVAGSKEQRRDVESIAEAGARIIAATLRERPAPTKTSILVRFPGQATANPGRGLPAALVVDLDEDPPLALAVHKILRAMLHRRALEMQGIPGPVGNLDWLAAALTHRLLQNFPGLMATPAVFPPGEPPSLAGLAANPVPPEQELFHALYARWCDAALAVLEAQQAPDERRIGRIFELEAAGREPADAIQNAMLDRFAARETLQDWFRRTVAASPKPTVRRLTADEVQARVAALETTALAAVPADTTPCPAGGDNAPVAPVIGPGRSDVPQTPRPAAEKNSPANAAAPRANDEMLLGLYNGFLGLYVDAPVLVHPAIRLYIDGVNELRAGNAARMRRAFADARKTFDALLQKQRQVEGCLDAIEKKTASPDEDLLTPCLVKLSLDNRLRHQRLAPDLHAWLDRLENAPPEKSQPEPAPKPTDGK